MGAMIKIETDNFCSNLFEVLEISQKNIFFSDHITKYWL